MKIGFDLDGVVCNIATSTFRLLDQLPDEKRHDFETWYYAETKLLLNPELLTLAEDEIYIITARPKDQEKITKEWLKKFVPRASEFPFIIVLGCDRCPKEENKISEWFNTIVDVKAEVINKLEIEIYFEDSPIIVRELRKKCPKTKVLLFGGRLK